MFCKYVKWKAFAPDRSSEAVSDPRIKFHDSTCYTYANLIDTLCVCGGGDGTTTTMTPTSVDFKNEG